MKRFVFSAIGAAILVAGPTFAGDRSKPPQIVAGQISDRAYPAEAKASTQEGVVVATVMVGKDGKAENCQIEKSSAFASLDAATCDILLRRLRFKGGRDSVGKPIARVFRQRVAWMLGSPCPPLGPADICIRPD